MKSSRCCSPSVHIMNTSSMNLHQMNGLNRAFSMACSGLRVAYEGVMRVPIAVPCIRKWCSLLKEKLFIVRIILMRSHIRSPGSDLF